MGPAPFLWCSFAAEYAQEGPTNRAVGARGTTTRKDPPGPQVLKQTQFGRYRKRRRDHGEDGRAQELNER
eukprot:scaffold215558_cov17-Prasinocladus_malaysianus.AAC.1